MAEAVSGYRALAGGGSMAALSARAEDGLERIAQVAGRVLVAALTDPDPAAALGQASRDFEGTEFGLEFERILAILLREGELPELRR